MTRWLSRILGRDDPPTLLAQYRALWHVPADWQHKPTWRVLAKKRLAMVKGNERKRA